MTLFGEIGIESCCGGHRNTRGGFWRPVELFDAGVAKAWRVIPLNGAYDSRTVNDKNNISKATLIQAAGAMESLTRDGYGH